jgi:heme/copper-type cytochrome/quinol oxidase subunit 1
MTGQHPPNGKTEIAAIPKGLRILAMFLRALVFGALVAMTVHLSSPQSETIWTVYDTPGDLIRLAKSRRRLADQTGANKTVRRTARVNFFSFAALSLGQFVLFHRCVFLQDHGCTLWWSFNALTTRGMSASLRKRPSYLHRSERRLVPTADIQW